MRSVWFAYVCLIAQINFAQNYVPTTATIIVRDEKGQPVDNVLLEGGFRDVSNSGSRDRFLGRTDSNGIFTAKGKAMIGVGVRATLEGYYHTIASVSLDLKPGARLKHWDIQIPVVLKHIRNPIPMYARHVNNFSFKQFDRVGVYCLGRTSSYDFVRGAFLPPYGTGEVADVEFR